MKYTVKHISRGSAYVTDGANEYCVDGEGLHGDKDGDADYILYKDSIRCTTCPENSVVCESTKVAIVKVIVAKFSENNMNVEVT